jgi:hypothetical protein
MDGLKFLKQPGLAEFPITVTVRLSLPFELEQNAKMILAFAFIQTFTGPLEMVLPGRIIKIRAHPRCRDL